ncbi:NAD-dependent epimerase/dehydratase family protein [Desulfovibrio cuneatus]|uniref:NAD-dependent epimerase/dehydratase family protein n=1 Tax=Desulfovibrio cuneatus TaxID=159728 RepID=UPI00041BA04A|nr:NAD-dependent epimerase/dehydratase family protein [Desulfovibrio cuneatus]
MNFSGANVLITGGAGFIGSNLARTLVHMQANVTLVDSFIPEYGGNLENIADIRDKITLNIADVRDQHAMRYLVQGKDFLFNLAGQTSHMDSMTDPFTDLEINSRAQLFILESCRLHNPGIRIVFAGTRQIYGKPDYLPVDEKHALRPVDINGINKLAGEWYHLLYNTVYGIRSTILRLTNTYGPCMRIKDARQTFVGIWIRRLLEGQPFEVWGGEQLRDFTYVDDCVTALLLAAQAPQACGKVYNIGGDKVVSLKELADILIAVHGSGNYLLKEFPAERKKIDIGDYYSQDELIRKELGWAPQVPLEQGLATTLNYYTRHLKAYL